MTYFSDKNRKPRKRDIESIDPTIWSGIVAEIQSQILSCGFAKQFPELCPDGAGPVATNEKLFSAAIQAEIPGVVWPFQTTVLSSDRYTYEPFSPDTYQILDIIEFCYRRISKAITGSYHSYFSHHHLRFDDELGKVEFRERINTIFERNGIAFELNESGSIERLVSSPNIKRISKKIEPILDEMLEESIRKILNPRISIRKEALERLWDAWERIKSLKDPNKKESIKIILNLVSADISFRELIENEAKCLTEIGNKFQIRHTEVDKVPIINKEYIDYLFYRMFSFINLILSKIK